MLSRRGNTGKEVIVKIELCCNETSKGSLLRGYAPEDVSQEMKVKCLFSVLKLQVLNLEEGFIL